MTFARAVALVGLALYAFLWVLAAHGVASLVAPLLVPPVLALLVALGVRLHRWLGLPTRGPRFHDREDDPGS